MFKNCCCKYIFPCKKSKVSTSFPNIIFPKHVKSESQTSLMRKYKVVPLNKITFHQDNFGEILGEGGAGIVYKYTFNNQIYACKKMIKRTEKVLNEINIMSLYSNHKNIVTYFGCHLNEYETLKHTNHHKKNDRHVQSHNPHIDVRHSIPKPKYIFMEYCQGKELFEVLQTNYQYETIVYILYQLLTAIKHLQKYNIVHADIKLENIIINDKHEIKLIDFGLSKVIHTGKYLPIKHNIGTIGYVSPEVMINNYITMRTDIWSVGILTYILLNNGHLFDVIDRDTYRKQLIDLKSILSKGLLIYNRTVPISKYNDIQTFLTKTICYDNKRYTVTNGLNNEIFSNVNTYKCTENEVLV